MLKGAIVVRGSRDRYCLMCEVAILALVVAKCILNMGRVRIEIKLPFEERKVTDSIMCESEG